MPEFVGAIDQGTTSTRFMIFDHQGGVVGAHQLEHQQILPRAGWIEHDPLEIWRRTENVIEVALDAARLTAADLAAVGITNQRETTVVWDPRTGRPYQNAIVWQDTRTDRIAAQLERDGRGEVIRENGRGCRPRRTSPAGSCSGCWRTSTACGTPPSRAASRSAPRTAGCCGTSPGAGPAGCTSPTRPTRPAPCSWSLRRWTGTTSSSASSASRARCCPQIRPSADPDSYGGTLVRGPLPRRGAG